MEIRLAVLLKVLRQLNTLAENHPNLLCNPP